MTRTRRHRSPAKKKNVTRAASPASNRRPLKRVRTDGDRPAGINAAAGRFRQGDGEMHPDELERGTHGAIGWIALLGYLVVCGLLLTKTYGG
jgi:hypothetical protein